MTLPMLQLKLWQLCNDAVKWHVICFFPNYGIVGFGGGGGVVAYPVYVGTIYSSCCWRALDKN